MALILATAVAEALLTQPTLRVAGARHLVPRSRGVLLQVDKAERPAPFAFFQRDDDVPVDQTPVFELQALRSQPFYDWADTSEGLKGNLFKLFVGITLLLSLPVSYNTYHQLPFELPQLIIAANLGTLAVMIPFVLRLRVGWTSVSTRLKQKSFYYESQQRGLFARKDRAEAGRDRLIQKETVAPILRRLDVSVIALIAALFLTFVSAEAITAFEGESGPTTLKTIYGDEAIQFTNRLRGDDAFARREQERAQRKADANGEGLQPGYCDSRYYKILAGGNGQGGVGCS